MDSHGKQGEVYLQHQKHGEKWKRYWLALHPPSGHGVARLEFSEAVPERTGVVVRRHPERKVVRLADCVSVVKLPPHAEACPRENMAAFCVETEDKKLVFAAEKGSCGEWVEIICNIAFQKRSSGTQQVPLMEDNEIYMSREQMDEFKVVVVPTEASVCCGLKGSYFLHAGENMLVLRELENRKVVMEWPYKLLRRYGRDKMLFSIEAGRRCMSGPGTFHFETKNSEDILRLTESAIHQQKTLTVNGGHQSPHSPRSRSPRSPLPRRPESFTSLDAEGSNSPDRNETSESVYSKSADALVPNLNAFSNPVHMRPASPIGLKENVYAKPAEALAFSKSNHSDPGGGASSVEPVYSNPVDFIGQHEPVYAQPTDSIVSHHTIKKNQSTLQSSLPPSHKHDSEPVYSDPADLIRSSPKADICDYANPADVMNSGVAKAPPNNDKQQEPVYSEVYGHVTQNSSKKTDQTIEEPVYSVPEVPSPKANQANQNNNSQQNKMPDEIIYSKVNRPPKTPQPQEKNCSQTPDIICEDLGVI